MKYIEKLLDKLFNMDRSVICLFIFSILACIVNYVYQIVLGNMLTLSNYGNFNTINSLTSNLVCLYSPLAVYICRITAENQKGLMKARHIYQKVFAVALGVSVVVFCAGGVFLWNFLGKNIGTKTICLELLILVMTLIAGFYTVINGILQGINRLGWYGFLGLLLVAVKLGLSYVGIRLGGQIHAAVWAMLISYVIITFAMIAIIAAIRKGQHSITCKEDYCCVEYKELLQLYGATFLVQMFVSPYINGGEVILMNYCYDSESVGLYSLAATVAKASMYVLSIFTSALLPNIAADLNQGKSIWKKFYISLAFCFLAGGAWVIFLMTAGVIIIPRLFGAGYYQALLNVKYMALWVIGIGMLLVVNTFYLAMNKLKRYISVLAVVTIFIIGYVSMSEIDILYVPVVIGVGVNAIIIFACFDVRFSDTRKS